MPAAHLEQLHRPQRRPRPAVLVGGKCINAAAEDFGGLLLVQAQFLPHAGDECRIDDGGIHLLVELQHCRAGPGGFGRVQHGLAAGRAIVAAHVRNGCRLALVGVAHFTLVADQLRRAAAWTFHVHISLKDTISTSSMTVSFR